jgi:hypothetical protein
MAQFKRPRYWRFVEEFPMTVTGKIQKYRLRELAITVGAPRAAFLIHDSTRAVLDPIATLGMVGRPYPSVPTAHPTHIAARAFRQRQALAEDGAAARTAEPVLAANGSPVLAAAITRANTGDDDAVAPLGVVVLSVVFLFRFGVVSSDS